MRYAIVIEKAKGKLLWELLRLRTRSCPGCVATGPTVRGGRAGAGNIRDAIRFHIAGLREERPAGFRLRRAIADYVEGLSGPGIRPSPAGGQTSYIRPVAGSPNQDHCP